MYDESRIMALLERILNGDCSPEDACRESPELLPVVRARLDQLRAVETELVAPFPPRLGPAIVEESRIMAVLEQILDSNCAPEDACRDCPDLLPVVRARLVQFRCVEAEVAAAFPPRPGSSNFSRAFLGAGPKSA